MEALFDSKLDGAFVIEFARRSVVIKLVNGLGKKPLNGLRSVWKEVGSEEFFEPSEHTFNNSSVSRSSNP